MTGQHPLRRRDVCKGVPTRASQLAVTALLCLGVASCGGASRQTGHSTATGAAAAQTTTGVAQTTQGHRYGDYDSDEENAAQVDGDDDDITAPLDGDGDSDNASASYYDGDDSSVLGYGRAAGAVDRRAITALIERYYAAAAARDGASACAMIVSPLANSVAVDLGRPPGPSYARGGTCAAVMSKVYARDHSQLAAYSSKLEVHAVRLHGPRGTAVLAFRALPARRMPVTREQGRWKIAALLDGELP